MSHAVSNAVTEHERLSCVADLLPPDGLPLPELDLLAEMASLHFAVDLVLINLTLTDTVWFAGTFGLSDEMIEQHGVPLEWLGEPGIRHSGDVERVDDFRPAEGLAYLMESQRIRSYSAVPMVTPVGIVVGSCYAMGRGPLALPDTQLIDLRNLSNVALAILRCTRH